MVAVVFWDVYGLKVSGWTFYWPLKIFTISLYFGLAYLVKKEKLSPTRAFEISMVQYYIYSYLGATYLHPTYMFSYYEGFAFWCFVYNGPALRFFLLSGFGIVLSLLSIEQMPEPDFIKEGFSIRPHLQVVSAIFCIISPVTYWFFSRQREIAFRKDQRFASIGRQSAFLLHELKSPLNRFMMSNSEKDNRDAAYILSIVEGVELLITKKENLYFSEFDWEEIDAYIQQEFDSICRYYKIKFFLSGFEGKGFGHRSTIKLALKNLIKNAVEAIAMEENQDGLIIISRQKNELVVSNNGSEISKEKLDQLFKPFYSDKKTGTGIGLHFVDSVARAHDGEVSARVADGMNIFRLRLGVMP